MRPQPLAAVAFCLLGCAAVAPGADDYKLGPDSMEQPGVPRGVVTKYSWTSQIFPETTRDYWVYVPNQYDPKVPACVMVFQDGENYARANGLFRVPIVFDNLIQRKEMPVTIGIFINPGKLPRGSNRSFEYDTLSDQYARFLEKEILPEVGKQYNLRSDAAGRAIGGISSGGICASPSPGSGPTCSAKSSATSAHSPTSATATLTRGSFGRRTPPGRSVSFSRTARATWTTSTATGR